MTPRLTIKDEPFLKVMETIMIKHPSNDTECTLCKKRFANTGDFLDHIGREHMDDYLPIS